MRRFNCFVLLFAAFLLISCSKEKPYEEKSVYVLYKEALKELKDGNFATAAQAFQEVERQHPYSDWAAKAQLMSAFCYYMGRNYDDSIRILNGLISYYPNYRYIDYAHYLLASNYLQEVPTIDRDVSGAVKARDSFIELSRRYPHSIYTPDAVKNVELLNNILAAHEMHVGRYYQNMNNALAALDRFKVVVNSFSDTNQVSEAYYRIIECYLSLGITEEAIRFYTEMIESTKESNWTIKARKILGK